VTHEIKWFWGVMRGSEAGGFSTAPAGLQCRQRLWRCVPWWVSWDGGKSDWLVRIESGEEVIRRHFKASNNADEKTLRTKAEETVKDEGYEANAGAVSIKR
jgi:hypothetical protein